MSARTSPERIVWGEIRDPRSAAGIALALNRGLTDLMATIHASSARKILERIEALRSEIADAIGFLIFMRLGEDGSRRVADVQHVAGVDAAGKFVLEAAA